MSATRQQPNVIMFFSDQQRWDTIGCYGQRLPVTPHLDRMAAEGTRFEYAFSCQPVCGPARACLQSGKYATQTGTFRNYAPFESNDKLLAEQMTDAGYEVGYIGKFHLARTREHPVPPELRAGYKDFWLAADALEHTSHGLEGGYMWDGNMQRVDFPGYRVDSQTDFVLNYLRTRDGQRPFFLFLSYLEPHHQNDRRRYEGPIGSKERFKDYDVPGDLEGTEGDWRENYPDYLGCCASLDENLGRIRAELERLGMGENTVILYTSDHGSHFCTRNNEYKRSCHESSLRVPMIGWGPGFMGGQVVDELVSLIDVPPTILAAGGVDTPGYMQGRPLQSLVDGSATDWPQEIFAQISEEHIGRTVRTRRWKYAVGVPKDIPGYGGNDRGGSEVYIESFLYDLESDPHERNNLVDDPAYAGVRAEMAAILQRKMAEAQEPVPQILPAGSAFPVEVAL